jgi:hypothetical protein
MQIYRKYEEIKYLENRMKQKKYTRYREKEIVYVR